MVWCALAGVRAVVVTGTGTGVVIPRAAVVVRRVLDLVLRHVHRHSSVAVVDDGDRASRDQPLLPEDPEASVDDYVATAGVIGGLVD